MSTPKKPQFERRIERLGKETLCGECSACATSKWCDPARPTPENLVLRDYGGIRLTADGYDCALPVTIDSHSHCSFGCVYCFSENLHGHVGIERPIIKPPQSRHSVAVQWDGYGIWRGIAAGLEGRS